MRIENESNTMNLVDDALNSLDELPDYFIVGGQARKSEDVQTVVDPGSGTPLVNMSMGTTRDIDDAVAAARDALADWKSMSPKARGRLSCSAAAPFLAYCNPMCYRSAL